jgi:alkanesulfonate monooxygenase SsuD/methylene tetrahydromethanopterin reductase-like flavin-dependent oxidoreductase (luciferase family)
MVILLLFRSLNSIVILSCFIWSWLGAAAAITHSIELGTGLTCPILRYNPAVIAQAAATVSSLAGGRTYLAVGTGEALNEYSVTLEWPEYDETSDSHDRSNRTYPQTLDRREGQF